jgi:hypothetical protein
MVFLAVGGLEPPSSHVDPPLSPITEGVLQCLVRLSLAHEPGWSPTGQVPEMQRLWLVKLHLLGQENVRSAGSNDTFTLHLG